MRFYLHLQYVRFRRILQEDGIHPILACGVFLIVFVSLSQLIVSGSEIGVWLYVLVAAILFAKLRSRELARHIFFRRSFYALILIETILFSTPFALVLLFNRFYYLIPVLIMALLGVAFFKTPHQILPKIPTPFYQRPFEFVVGFRRTFIPILLLNGLIVISIVVGNINLGLVALSANYLVIAGFYSSTEPVLFVWNYSLSTNQFLRYKTFTAIIYANVTVLPAAFFLGLFFPSHWHIVVIICLLGPLIPVTSVLSKYVTFPRNSEFINTVFIGFCILFPPIFLFVIPYLAGKASENLKSYL